MVDYITDVVSSVRMIFPSTSPNRRRATVAHQQMAGEEADPPPGRQNVKRRFLSRKIKLFSAAFIGFTIL
ncbi:hypothetical protein OK142_08550 [Agrobacterium sp. BT-220-3]|nr:hypothetical protein [Agrobacterium sp. BT-220-3]